MVRGLQPRGAAEQQRQQVAPRLFERCGPLQRQLLAGVAHSAALASCLGGRPRWVPMRAGVDVGDHPPITPVRMATEMELGGGDAWRLYE